MKGLAIAKLFHWSSAIATTFLIGYASDGQSYSAISQRFGFPAYRDNLTDDYKLPNGRWVAIQYAGRTAAGLKFSDSGG